jgi:hypothetical protein
MAVFKVETYVVKPEKQVEYMAVMKKWAAYMKRNKQKCKELRSWRLFSQMFGGTAGGYVEIAEFENLAALEKSMHKIFHGQEKSIVEIVSGFTSSLVPGTYSVNVWSSVM